MLMSVGGIAFGVGFFVVTLAQISGFEEFFIKTILGTDGAIRIEDRIQDVRIDTMKSNNGKMISGSRSNVRYIEGIDFPDDVVAAVSTLPNVAGTSKVLKGDVSLVSTQRRENGQVLGIDLENHLLVSNLRDQVSLGSLEDFRDTPNGVFLGSKLATRLKTRVGDSIAFEVTGERLRFRISGVFETGVSDIDRVRVFMHLDQARSLLKKPNGVSFVQVSLFDRDMARRDASAMERLTLHSAAPWLEREKSWLEVFRALKFSGAITVSTIILISGLGMYNTLAMVVMEKTREIAILRSMGYTRQDIAAIFFWQGGIVYALGVIVGFLLGASATYGISSLPLRIRGIFSTDSFVVEWSVEHYILAALTAAAIVAISSLLPARRAARLVPGDVIRGTAS